MTDKDLDRLFKEREYPNTPAGQIRKAKDALNVLKCQLGDQPWITMVYTVLDFQEHLLAHPGAVYKPVTAAIKAFVRAS